MRVVRSDLDEVGYCANQSRVWAARMGLSWSDFVFNGIDAEVLRATGDAMALKIVEHVEARNGSR